MRHPWLLLVLAGALACGDDGGAPSAPAPASFTLNDPRGDTIAWAGARGRAHDVLHLDARSTDGALVVAIQFADLVRPQSVGTHDAVLGIVDIDIDDDSLTGESPVADDFGATARIGAEWSLTLQDSTMAAGDRRVALEHLATRAIHWVAARFDGTTVTATIPLALLHARPGARVRLVGVVGTLERVSDVVPNAGSLLVEVP